MAQARARREHPVEAVQQELNDCISLYRRGEFSALPFLQSMATNISVVRVTQSANTNLSCLAAVLLVDGARHYLEIPVSVFPMVLIETLPPAPTEAEFREHVNQQVQHVLKGEQSDLRLSSYYRWTNIVIESLTLPTNYGRSYPYQAEVVLLAEASGPDTGAPLRHRIRLEVDNTDQDHWLVLRRQGAP